MSKLTGKWRKQAGEACASAYPAELDFRPDGQYRGQAEIPGNYAVWDVGTWAETGPDQVELSTANDAVIRYRYRLDGEALRFEDDQGCTIAYARAEG